MRRAEDHVADRRRLVVDVAEASAQACVVERGGAEQPDLLLRGEEELDPGVRPVLGEHAPRRVEHRGDGRLVVGSEDRAAGVPHQALLDDGLDRPDRRNGVEVRAEEDRRPLGRRLDAGEDVPDRRLDRGPGVVLVRREAEVAEVRGHDVGDGALLPGWARDRGQLGEKVEHLVRHGAILGCHGVTARPVPLPRGSWSVWRQ
jgi:hypothetical protein